MWTAIGHPNGKRPVPWFKLREPEEDVGRACRDQLLALDLVANFHHRLLGL